jgi:AcrR family transcriptional regulator
MSTWLRGSGQPLGVEDGVADGVALGVEDTDALGLGVSLRVGVGGSLALRLGDSEGVLDGLVDCEAVADELGVFEGVADGSAAWPIPSEVRCGSLREVPPVYVETGRPAISSKPTITAIATRNTPAATAATRFHGIRASASRHCGRAASSTSASASARSCSGGGWVLPLALPDRRTRAIAAICAAAATRSRLTRSEYEYRALPTVTMTLPTAAPITVPATPTVDSRTAEDTAAKALATTWTTLTSTRGFSSSSTRPSLAQAGRPRAAGVSGPGWTDRRPGRTLLTMLGTPNRDRTTERREATRQEILDAAWALAAEHGLSQITLRQVADRIGMRAPSLYTHFAGKNAIYDAMFGQAWSEYLAVAQEAYRTRPSSPRAALRTYARTFFDFAAGDLARHQLMNQRTIPGFEPTAEAYAPAVAVLELFRERLRELGVTRDEDVDLCTSLIGGLVDAQLANDPGGNRWGRLVDRAVEMFADNVGLPHDDDEERR